MRLFVKTVKKNLKVANRVELMDGKSGVIKWIGEYDMDGFYYDDIIGIELDEWSINGNDGRGYFEVKRGMGYFTTAEFIATFSV